MDLNRSYCSNQFALELNTVDVVYEQYGLNVDDVLATNEVCIALYGFKESVEAGESNEEVRWKRTTYIHVHPCISLRCNSSLSIGYMITGSKVFHSQTYQGSSYIDQVVNSYHSLSFTSTIVALNQSNVLNLFCDGAYPLH